MDNEILKNNTNEKNTISYYVISDIATWTNNSPEKAKLERFEDFGTAVSEYEKYRYNMGKFEDTEVHTVFGAAFNGYDFDVVMARKNDNILSLDFSKSDKVIKNDTFKDTLKNICIHLEVGKVRVHRIMSPDEVKDFTKERFQAHLKKTNCDDIDFYMENFDKAYEKGNLSRYEPSVNQKKITEDLSFMEWNMDNPYFDLDMPDEIAYSVDNDKFIGVQTCEDGYDYSVYDTDYKLIDGGVYDNPDISIYSVLKTVIDEYCASANIVESVDYIELMERVEETEKIISVISDFKDKTREQFHSIDGQTADEIEKMATDYIMGKICDMNDVHIVDVAISGSRCRGLEEDDNSDIDIVCEFTGDIREDDLYDIMHEDGFKIAGKKVDINPITCGKTGTLSEYLPQVEKYLENKARNINSIDNNRNHKRRGR